MTILWLFQEEVCHSYSRVLVTGATGLLGRAVYKEFQNNNWETLGCGYTRARPRFLSCNLLDEDAVRSVIHNFQVLTCSLHLEQQFAVFSSGISASCCMLFMFPLMLSSFLTSCCVLCMQPHVIIHCAAERRPDVVEHHTEAALNLNVHACATLAKEAGWSSHQSPYIHTSKQQSKIQILCIVGSIMTQFL